MALFAEGKLFQKAGEGSGGGDKHNKGYFVDESALTTAYPTAEAGDYAIVESTDTVWIWDSDNQEWVDSDQKGQVTSVNNQTGDVTITASDLGALPTSGGVMTAPIQFYGSAMTLSNAAIQSGAQSSSQGLSIGSVANGIFNPFYRFGHTNITPESGGAQSLGSLQKPFSGLYVSALFSSNNKAIHIPTATGTIALQENIMPTADAASVGVIVQYVGTTDANYTHGYVYECVSTPSSAVATSSNPDVTVSVNVTTFETQITTTGQYVFEYDAGTDTWYDSNNNPVVLADYGITKEGVSISQDTITIDYTAAGYSWTQIDVQPAGATYTAGNGISIDANNEISVTAPTLVNAATGMQSTSINGTASSSYFATNVGFASQAAGSGATSCGRGSFAYDYGTAIGYGATVWVNSTGGIALGANAKTDANYAIQIGSNGSQTTNSDAGTVKVANPNGNFEIMSADGTVPTARLTKVNTTATLAVADWSSSTQTVTVSGVKADSVVFVSPAPASAGDYASAGILCTAQAADSLTFTCTTTPTSAITVNVVCM